jgi:hypothetical protein
MQEEATAMATRRRTEATTVAPAVGEQPDSGGKRPPASSWTPIELTETTLAALREDYDDASEKIAHLAAVAADFLEEFVIRCACGEPATHLHCRPYFRHPWDRRFNADDADMMTIVPACGEWDPDGYPIPLDGPTGFWLDKEDWLRHLYGKSRRAAEQLVEWLLDRCPDSEANLDAGAAGE